MKTTLDIPDELYRRIKAQAALENIKVKELVSEGLALALKRRAGGDPAPAPLEVMQEIHRHPLHPPDEVERMMAQARNERHGGWNREDVEQ